MYICICIYIYYIIHSLYILFIFRKFPWKTIGKMRFSKPSDSLGINMRDGSPCQVPIGTRSSIRTRPESREVTRGHAWSIESQCKKKTLSSVRIANWNYVYIHVTDRHLFSGLIFWAFMMSHRRFDFQQRSLVDMPNLRHPARDITLSWVFNWAIPNDSSRRETLVRHMHNYVPLNLSRSKWSYNGHQQFSEWFQVPSIMHGKLVVKLRWPPKYLRSTFASHTKQQVAPPKLYPSLFWLYPSIDASACQCHFMVVKTKYYTN